MDNIGFVELFENVFCFIMTSEVESPTIYQVSTSWISLIMKGGGVVCTKHLRAWVNLYKEELEEKWLRVGYVLTLRTIADGLAKTLGGMHALMV